MKLVTRNNLALFTQLRDHTSEIIMWDSNTYSSITFCILVRVTSLEQLSLTEFSGELFRPKVNGSDRKNVLGIWIDFGTILCPFS